MNNDLFEQYKRETEPDKQYKSYLWATAIGLQKVDNLKTSDFLNEIAKENIEGKITFDEVQNRVNKYYRSDENKAEKILTEEGDKVSANMVRVLAEQAFTLTPNEYTSIHRKLFNGVLKRAGKIRDFNITKEEWVLSGDTVIYGTASELKTTLEYDILQEKNFNYDNLDIEETIDHLSDFISRLWQIHVFEEGNTRTTSIFLIKYLRTLGYNVSNEIFAQNARYFRNALVRANYSNLKLGVNKTNEYLKIFFRNLLMHENNELKSRYLHIDQEFVKYLREQEKNKKIDIQNKKADIRNKKADIRNKKADIQNKKADIRNKKADIQNKKVDIRDKKVDIQNKKVDIRDKKVDIRDKKADIRDKKVDIRELSAINQSHIKRMYTVFGGNTVFGRTETEKILGLKSARTSKLLKVLLDKNIIRAVKGFGKGKYKFSIDL